MVTSHPVSGWHILRISNNFISYAPKSLHYTHAGQAGVWILYNTNVRMAVTFHGPGPRPGAGPLSSREESVLVGPLLVEPRSLVAPD